MSEKVSEKYEKVKLKIEKSISPYITIKIPMPESVEKETFLALENDTQFIESLEKYVEKWLKREINE